MKKRKNRGEVVSGFTTMLVVIAIAIAQAGVLFTGGPGAVAGSTMFLTAIGGAGLATQLDASVDPHRENKAVEICQYNGGQDCKTFAESMTNEEKLAYIEDGNPNNDAYYKESWLNSIPSNKTSGGGLRTRVLAKQN